MIKNFTVVLEGLPASGKTTLAKRLNLWGFGIVNESLGHLKITGNQKAVFEETVLKYQQTQKYNHSVIDRGYPSLLAWDYCEEILHRAKNLTEKEIWINKAIANKEIFEPDLYVYLKINPKTSLIRRPRDYNQKDVWSDLKGLQVCSEYYEKFFNDKIISNRVITIDAEQNSDQITNQVLDFFNIYEN